MNYNSMRPLMALLLSGAFGTTYAADKMTKTEPMAKETMARDSMNHDMMGKDGMAMTPHFIAYTDATFDAAQQAGQSMVVAVSASWCPVCKGQEMTLNKLMAQPAYAKTAFFRVDFDSQKAAVERFKATKQSTLIAFRGKSEMGRIEYTADKAKVMALAAKAKSS
jgi:thioredoxin 1